MSRKKGGCKSKSVFLNQDDYEFYKIPIPLKLLRGKRRNSFFNAELDKRHPYFSDDFVFDEKLGFEKSGFIGNVVVMPGFRLEEIRRENRGKKIRIAERKGSFFDVGLRKTLKNPLIYGALAGVFAAGIFVSLAVKADFKKKELAEAEKRAAVQRLNESDFLTKTENQVEKVDVGAIFDVVREKNGKISSLEWQFENFKENFQIQVSGLYPEFFYDAVSEVTVSAVSYSKNVPFMVVSGSGCWKPKPEGEKVVEKPLEKTGVMPKIREVLKNHNCEVKEENGRSVSFCVYMKKSDVAAGRFGKEVFEQLWSVAKDYGVQVSKVCIRNVGKTGNGGKTGNAGSVGSVGKTGKAAGGGSGETFGIEVTLGFSGIAADGGNLELIGKNLDLFVENRRMAEEMPLETWEKSEKSGKSAKLDLAGGQKNQIVKKELPGKKIGEVTYGGREKIVFYKSPEGKTVRIKEKIE